MKTRAELIEGLSRLQMDRLESKDYPTGDEYLKRKYWYYHDKNAKLGTLKLKNRIAREVMWKAQSNRV